jgi:hypothetical protein
MGIIIRVETTEVGRTVEIVTRDSMVDMGISSTVVDMVEIMIMECRVEVPLTKVEDTRTTMMERASPRDLIASSRVSTSSLLDCRVLPRTSLAAAEEAGLPLEPDRAGVETGSKRTEEILCYERLFLANNAMLLLRRMRWRFFVSLLIYLTKNKM